MGLERLDKRSCASFRTALSPWLDGALPQSETAALEAHARACAACAAELGSARAVEQLWRSWHVPQPPRGFADRVMERLRTAPAAPRLTCAQFAARLEAHLDDDLDHDAAWAMERHAQACDGCGEQLRLGQESERLFQRWTVPPAAHDFVDRCMQRLAAERTALRARGWRAAAAILVPVAAAALILLAVHRLVQAPHTGQESEPVAERPAIDTARPLDLASSSALWPLATDELGADPLSARRAPLGETFRRSLQRVSHQPGR